MRRKLLNAILLLMLVPALGFCASSYLRINDRCTIVDLASKNFCTHLLYVDNGVGSVYDEEGGQNTTPTNLKDTGLYYYKQNLAVVGITGIRTKVGGNYVAEGPVTLSVSAPAGGWYYTLPGWDEYQRPFGIDVFARGRTSSGDTNVVNANNQMIYCGHFGNQDKTTTLQSGTITIPAEVVAKYDYIWWDISLVLDPQVDEISESVTYNGTVYPLNATTSYYTSELNISIACNNNPETHHIYLAGYYSPDHAVSTDMTAILNVTRYPAAGSLDINEMAKNGTEVTIAKYGFSTDSKAAARYQNGKVYMFLSSSPNARAASSTFTLNKISDTGTYILPHNPTSTNLIHYKAYLNSEEGYTYANETSSRTFEGTSYQTSIQYSGNDTINTHNYLRLNPESFKDKDNKTYYHFIDRGTISIMIPGDVAFQERDIFDSQDPDFINLESGLYTSTIYVHIVTDFP